MIKKWINLFVAHPKALDETYLQHAKFAMTVFFKLTIININILIHAVFPFARQSYASTRIENLAQQLSKRHQSQGVSSGSLEKEADKVVSKNIAQLIGQTPLIDISDLSTNKNIKIYAKCEMFNPSLSIKDRIVLQMIEKLKLSGELQQNGTIVEASSGNTGSSLAMLAACFGYKAIVTVPAKTSQEKIATMRAFGATVFVSPPDASKASDEHYTNKAKIIVAATKNAVFLNQYENPVNPNTHYEQTAEEIWTALNGDINYVVACSSSGGTISGIGNYLKKKNAEIKMIMPDPVGSIYTHYFDKPEEPLATYQPYALEGIGKDYICGTIDFSVIDDVIPITDNEAFSSARSLAVKTGILAGGSSGAALHVAIAYAENLRNENKAGNMVVILPDSGFKYLSKFYAEENENSNN